jgi:hypothetical protein
LAAIAVAPCSTELLAMVDRGLVLGLLVSLVDIVSRGSDADSVGGGNTPGDLHYTWLGLLGGDDDRGFLSFLGYHLPGLGRRRWRRGLLLPCLPPLSLVGRGARVGRVFLVLFAGVGCGDRGGGGHLGHSRVVCRNSVRAFLITERGLRIERAGSAFLNWRE